MSDCSRGVRPVDFPTKGLLTAKLSPDLGSSSYPQTLWVFASPNTWNTNIMHNRYLLLKYVSILGVDRTWSSTKNYHSKYLARCSSCGSLVNQLWVQEDLGLCHWIRVRTSGRDSASDGRETRQLLPCSPESSLGEHAEFFEQASCAQKLTLLQDDFPTPQ